MLWRDGDGTIRLRTLSDYVDRNGREVDAAYDSEARRILAREGFDPQTALPAPGTVIPGAISAPCALGERESSGARKTEADAAIKDFNVGRESACSIKDDALVASVEQDPNSCCYVYIDDIGVKAQKEKRKGGGLKKGAYVQNTDICVSVCGKSWYITAVGMDNAMRQLVALLLENRLMSDRHLIFISDGAASIRSALERYFTYCPHVLYLDWLHLRKKVKEYLSMAFRGTRDQRHEAIKAVLNRLWAGNVDDAISWLNSLDAKSVKNRQELSAMVDYLVRKKPCIPCYALRAKLGLRNSSNSVEKQNDLLVAQRQKHNGMAWSCTGSGALASLSMLVRNNALRKWETSHEIDFKFDFPSKVA